MRTLRCRIALAALACTALTPALAAEVRDAEASMPLTSNFNMEVTPLAAHFDRTVDAARPAWLAPRSPATWLDARAWLGSGRASFGVGLATASYDYPAPMLDPGLVVGMRYRLSTRSQFTFDAGRAMPLAGEATSTERRMRVGMEFKSPPSAMLGLARGTLLRTQLSATSNLSLRMRRGGLALVVRAEF